MAHGFDANVPADDDTSSDRGRASAPPPRVVRRADLDWVKFDAELARDGSVDPVDKALYAALASFADAEDRETNPDPEGGDVPTRSVLAACIGRSVDTVDRATKRLEERGLIRVERRRNPDNPRAHLPSVYELLDHELWDERAAARAEARRAARDKRRQEASEGGRTGAARGSRMDAARGGRTGAARGSRTSAAVPLSLKKVSLSEVTQDPSVPSPRTSPEPLAGGEERERTATPDEPQALPGAADQIARAWTNGTGLPRVPASETKIHDQAVELLTEGHSPTRLALVAHWMGGRGYRDLGYALTHPNAPKDNSEPSGASLARPEWCGECDEPTRVLIADDGTGKWCPACSGKAAVSA